MGKSLRYLLLSSRDNYLSLPLVGGILIFLCCLSGVPATGEGIFSIYFQLYPVFLLIVSMFSGVSLTTLTLSTALSYGAKRRDYFKAMLVMNLFNALIFWLSDCLLSLLPHLLGWACADALDEVIVSWSLPFLLLAASCGGCALGELVYRHRIIAGLLGGVMGSSSILIISFLNVMEPSSGLWGNLPWILPLICLCLSVLCMFRVRTKTLTAVVR